MVLCFGRGVVSVSYWEVRNFLCFTLVGTNAIAIIPSEHVGGRLSSLDFESDFFSFELGYFFHAETAGVE